MCFTTSHFGESFSQICSLPDLIRRKFHKAKYSTRRVVRFDTVFTNCAVFIAGIVG